MDAGGAYCAAFKLDHPDDGVGVARQLLQPFLLRLDAGGCRSDRKRVTSRSSNQVIITATASARGGRRQTSLPWMTGPYMGRKVKPLARRVELRRFLDVDRNRRPLRRRQVEGAQVLSLRRRRLVANQRVHERRQVLVQLSRVERNLADGGVDNAELIGTKLDLAALDLAHGTRDVLGDGARLGVWHQTTRSEDLAQRADPRHHVRRRDRGIKVRPAVRHPLDEVLSAHEVRACFLRLARAVTDCEDGNAHLLAGAVGQDDRPTHHLLRVSRIDAKADVRLYGGVELGYRGVLGERYRLLGGEPAVAVGRHCGLDLLGRLDVFLPVSLRHRYSMTSRPIDRAVPSIIFMAASVSNALRSLRLVSTMVRSCCRVTRPIFSRFGFGDPFSTPAARLSRFTVGGVLRTNVKDRSSKIVISAGTTSPAWAAVRSL